MKRRLGLICLLLLASLPARSAPADFAAPPRPNIIVILADDFGFGDLSSYGGEVATPNLDRLSRQGTRFTQFYAAAPICSPSRAGLLTGQYPGRWRMTSFLQTRKGNAGCEQADFLDPKAPTLPRLLKSAGYATAHIGKWHLGGGRDVTNAPPFSAYGYDLGLGTYESPEPHPDITGTNWIWSAHDKVKRHQRTEWMVDRTLDFLRKNRGKPCFINLWLDDTHTPFVPSLEQLAAAGVKTDRPTDRQKYRAVLTEMDRQLGRLVQTLVADGAQNTLLLFMGDNGALPVFGSRNGKLRASKLSLYEGGIRVPLIAVWPNRIPAARVDETNLISGLDLTPTLASVAGVSIPSSIQLDGEDRSAIFLGRTNQGARSRPIFWEYGRNTNWFKFPGNPLDQSPNLAMREGKWKLLMNADGSQTELYDVVEDPSEARNQVTENEALASRLKGKLLEWRKSLP